MRKSTVVLGLMLAACGHTNEVGSAHTAPIAALSPRNVQAAPSAQPRPQAGPSAALEPRAEWTRTVQHVVSELCDGRASSPSEQTIVVDGARVQQPCGLVALEFHAQAFARFAHDACDEAPESASVDCYRAWYGAFISRVLQRYTHADLRSFPQWCEDHSAECDDLKAAEMWFLNSHSSGLRAAYAASQTRPVPQAP